MEPEKQEAAYTKARRLGREAQEAEDAYRALEAEQRKREEELSEALAP